MNDAHQDLGDHAQTAFWDSILGACGRDLGNISWPSILIRDAYLADTGPGPGPSASRLFGGRRGSGAVSFRRFGSKMYKPVVACMLLRLFSPSLYPLVNSTGHTGIIYLFIQVLFIYLFISSSFLTS